jgi:DNA-binding NarL/FixJ family response regulator
LEETKLIRVIIVEDNPYIREGWTTMLDSEKKIVVKSTFRSCEDALESNDIAWCDIMLLDIQLPGMLGTDAVEKFLDINPGLAIIMISVLEDSEHVFKALKHGAIGYFVKNISPDELVKAVKDAHSGGSPMSPLIARKVIDSMQKLSAAKKEFKLSDRELEILNLLGEGKSYSAIADQIYLSVDGVSYHIRNIYRKLQVKSKAGAVAKGIANGLIKIEC